VFLAGCGKIVTTPWRQKASHGFTSQAQGQFGRDKTQLDEARRWVGNFPEVQTRYSARRRRRGIDRGRGPRGYQPRAWTVAFFGRWVEAHAFLAPALTPEMPEIAAAQTLLGELSTE
jgi:hypothetical protein